MGMKPADRQPSTVSRPALRVLFVCMGNICRSPSADGVMRALLVKAGWHNWVEVDSAGTHSYHVGSPPDPRSQAHALRRGYDLSDLRARQVCREDFLTYDYLLVMDRDNMAALQRLSPEGTCERLEFFTRYCQNPAPLDVPDPYSGGEAGFERVLDLIEDGCQGLLAVLEQRLRALQLFPDPSSASRAR